MKKHETPVHADYVLTLVTAALVIIGALMVFSSSVIMAETRFHSPYIFVFKHLIWVGIGAVAMFFFANYDYRKLQKFTKPLIFITAALLVLVVVIGTEKGGARRWFKFGPISFQPSELAKLSLVIALADFLDRKKSRLKNFKGHLPVYGLLGIFCVLIAFEPDLGTPIVMVVVTLSLLFVAGAKFTHIMTAAAACLPLVAVEIIRKPYRLLRVKSFIQSWWDISSTSYQLDNSILALGSGGFFGKGLAQGQMKLMYLPEPHTDFIFPIIGEELGFIGAIFLVTLFVAFLWRGWIIAKNSNDFFGGLLAIGITMLIVVQAFFNMAVASGVLPTKGLPLPFVSFGGSALMLNMAEAGILLSISQQHYGRK